MKKLAKALLAVAVVVGMSAGSAFASQGKISDRSLQKMGLQGMKAMSDEQGMKIRGTGHEGNPVIGLAFEILELIERNVNGHHHHR